MKFLKKLVDKVDKKMEEKSQECECCAAPKKKK